MIKKIINVTILAIILFFGFNISCTKVNAADTVDDVMNGASQFLKAGEKVHIKDDSLKSTSDFIYNLLLAIAIIVAVVIGMSIGIRFMMAGIDDKVKIKESLMPYFVGCVVVFGAFGIWKLAVTILSQW